MKNFTTFAESSAESGSDSNYTLRNNSESDSFNARAIFSTLTRATLRSPRSIPPMYVRSNSHRSANASWETPSLCLFCLTALPNLTRMSSIYPCASSLSLAVYVSTDYEYHCSSCPPIRINSTLCASCETVLSGFQRTELIRCRQVLDESMHCIAIVRESESTTSFMWEWPTVKREYALV
jgi:hypothetical protein